MMYEKLAHSFTLLLGHVYTMHSPVVLSESRHRDASRDDFVLTRYTTDVPSFQNIPNCCMITSREQEVCAIPFNSGYKH